MLPKIVTKRKIVNSEEKVGSWHFCPFDIRETNKNLNIVNEYGCSQRSWFLHWLCSWWLLQKECSWGHFPGEFLLWLFFLLKEKLQSAPWWIVKGVKPIIIICLCVCIYTLIWTFSMLHSNFVSSYSQFIVIIIYFMLTKLYSIHIHHYLHYTLQYVHYKYQSHISNCCPFLCIFFLAQMKAFISSQSIGYNELIFS